MANFMKGNLGTNQVTLDDVTTPVTQMFNAAKYVNDFKESKIVTFHAQDRGAGTKSITINTNGEEYLDTRNATITYLFQLRNKAGQHCKYDQIFLCCDYGNGIWERITVKINGREIIGLGMTHVGIIEYVKGLINQTHDATNSKMFARQFILDPAGFYSGGNFIKYNVSYTRNAEKGWTL